MYFLYEHEHNYKGLQNALVIAMGEKFEVDEFKVLTKKLDDGSFVQNFIVDDERVFVFHHKEGNFKFYEKNIQSKGSKSPTVYSLIERDVQING